MIPRAHDLVGTWREQRSRLGHLLIALDFDGTIAPIVSRPQEASMLAQARVVIERLLKRADTDVALVSGRSLHDLRARSRIAGAYYSGNHGLQIDGPGVHETRQDALALLPRVQAIGRELAHQLAGIEGVYLEDKELTLSVHSRMIEAEAERARVHDIVEQTYRARREGLKLTYGKRVIEVRPDVEWHKGEATLFLIGCIERARRSRVFPIFIGDDVTDEDAFRALAGRGAGVLVAPAPPPDTAARAWVRSPEEVVTLLEGLAR
ncbi:MAG: trehalose-phosphatase [Gemmatimonadota bacterium]